MCNLPLSVLILLWLYLLKHFAKNLLKALDLRLQWVRQAERETWGGEWGCICVCMSLGEGLLLRDGDIFWSLNGQSVPTETGSNVRSAMEWPPSCSLSSSFVRVHVCVAQKLNPFYPNPIWNIRIHWVWFIWRYDFFTDILFQMAPVLWLWWAGLWLSMSYRADMLMGL